VAAAGESLPFADDSFDCIWGNAILHHLDLRLAANELRRVLRPGGRAVFCEPWGENACLSWARRHLPYPGKQRTRDEAPLIERDLEPLRHAFGRVHFTGHQLFGMAGRLLTAHSLRTGLDWWDRQLLSRFPHLQRYCRYAVLVLER
jgi:SAM-dependent methyltransferase